ncbi:MAG: DMT family transporter [Calditrichaeota bacterium]|nr:MAG: DMT family transporter [Calditrichota bacterium]
MKRMSAPALMILSSFFLSLMSILVKASGSRLPSMEIVFFRSAIITLITFSMALKLKLPIWGRNVKLLIIRGLFGFVGLSAFFYTLTHIPIADSVTLLYTSPLFTAMIAPSMLKEKNTGKNWFYFLLAFIGLMLIVRPGFSLQFLPALVGVGGALFAGLAYNTVRKLRETEHEITVVYYFSFISTLLSSPSLLTDYVKPRFVEWLMLAGVGIFAFLAQWLMTQALHRDRAAKVMNMSYIGVVFSTILGIIFFMEIPDWRTIVGATIVIFSIINIARS